MTQNNLTNAQQTLSKYFGFDQFRPGQQQAIDRLLDGRSVLTIFPTGGGKSLCYQLPALMFDGLTVVISPLIALMKDQIDFLQSHDVPAARLDSSMEIADMTKVYEKLNKKQLKLLYVSPERLNNERFLNTLGRHKISLMAIDEAHCISEWGHNFRPDYLKIARLARELKVERILALTATATPEVADDVARQFSIAKEDVVHTGFYRPNLKLAVTPCTPRSRIEILIKRLNEQDRAPTIVYVTLQKTAEQIAYYLSSTGFNARAYHAGMDSQQRHEIQEAFMASDDIVIVATIAFGMGVDKSNIRAVYHYNVSKSMESYMQEIGRAGRDGKESHCELFACADDIVTLQNFSHGDTPDAESVKLMIKKVLSLGEEFDISAYELSSQYDMRILVVQTLLTYLELEGIIRSTGPFYTEFKFQPKKSSQEILARFDEERAGFIRKIFSHSRKGRTWFTLDANKIGEQINQPRSRIIAAINHLEETGDLIVQATGVRQGYRIIKLPENIQSLGETLSQRFLKREENDIQRVGRMVHYAQQEGCLTQHLLSYFGEKRENCGHCTRCDGHPAEPMPPANHTIPNESYIDELMLLREEHYTPLKSIRQMTRFLCGLGSPATTKAKLRKHALFGVYEAVPFNDVMAVITKHHPT
ncbi:MAG: RecQ family ATP-dependent DNA helicase [Phycisphaerae bacterium]|nr:RecQ family ATP-dependent DNA helicase [Phycisphaerae bacterium]